ARRLWKESYEECTLAALESRVLGVEREGDVPGYLIPELYFRYLRTGDPRPLGPVFYHNQMDILSLVGLLNEMIKLYQGEAENLSENVDWLRMGRAYDDMRAYDDGLKFYQDLLSQDLPPGKRTGVLLRIAAIHKKNRQYVEAVPFWQEALQQDGFCLEAYEELAKACEHRIIDLEKAKNYTQSALENLGVIDELRPNPHYEEARQGLLWRLKRLERKMGKRV
ncbi:MAG: ribonuclease H-like domain-containing protein, partial [bacterium]